MPIASMSYEAMAAIQAIAFSQIHNTTLAESLARIGMSAAGIIPRQMAKLLNTKLSRAEAALMVAMLSGGAMSVDAPAPADDSNKWMGFEFVDKGAIGGGYQA